MALAETVYTWILTLSHGAITIAVQLLYRHWSVASLVVFCVFSITAVLTSATLIWIAFLLRLATTATKSDRKAR